MAYDLKPFMINLNDLLYLLDQVNFVPLFDGVANSNGIINFNPASMDAYDAKGTQVWDWETQSGSYKGITLTAANVSLLGKGFPQVSSPIGIRDVSGLHNNLFGDQAFWGNVDVPFRRDVAADFTNYVTSPGANYTPGGNVVDYMPRVISRTITTAGVNLLQDAGGHYVNWDSARYTSDMTYANLVDDSGVDISLLVEGAKIVAPVNTEIAILDTNGDPLVWSMAAYQSSTVYTTLLASFANSSLGGLKDVNGQSLEAGEQIYYRSAFNPTALTNSGLTYQPNLLAYKQLIDANVDFGAGVPADGTAVTSTVSTSGYGLLETLGHVDFQQPNSAEFFIGSENPGVAPVNSWFAIFGQFFDHGLDLIGKGGSGRVKINLDPSDPMYGALGPDGQPVTKIFVTRASIAGTDANGDPNYVNHTSPFIDQSQTYGSDDQITNVLRKWESTDNGATFHAGIELLDGVTLVDSWERRWPDGTTTTVHDTLPTLNELRQHVLDTGRAAITWNDVLDFRNRDGDGQLSSGNSGHSLLLDMNPQFDSTRVPAAHLAALNTALADINFPPITNLSFGSLIGYGLINPSTNVINANFPSFMGGGPISQEVQHAVNDVMLDSVGDHYVAGDGRVNENFGLTAIHHVFHEEHNYQVANLKTWIYAHDANNPGATDAHEQLHNWQTNTGTTDTAGNYLNADGSIAWDAEKMFNATKLIVEMEYQHAAVDQYARTITPRIQEFVGYTSSVDSTVSLEFSQVAYRFGHSTIRETIDTLDPTGWMFGTVTRYALEKAFLNPTAFAEEGVAAITLGMARQQMNEVDEFITPALNQGLLGLPLDLAAINIARGRDLGIPTLNDFREGLSLARYTCWEDFGKNMIHPESLVNFIAAYSFGGNVAQAEAIVGLFEGTITEGSVEAMGYTAADALAFMFNNYTGTDVDLAKAQLGFDKIDSWMGGLAEAHVPGGLLGETFDAIFVAQIQSLMDGDRFYYLYRLFGTQIHEEVNNGQFKDIVERNTGLSHLNGSIFAYADKYYDFNRGADGTVEGAGDNLAEHFYKETLADNPTLGIYSDGGASTAPNGTLISVVASDYIRADVVQNYVRDVRPELDPTQVHTVEGTPTSGADSHEVIVATENADYIHGRAGDDTLYGEGGNDFLFADGGVDRIYGGAGDDLIDTGEGPDLADGGAGKDVIYGRGSGAEVGGFDQLVGGTGNDLIIGGEGIDKLSGGAGDDILYGDGLTNPEMGNTDAFTHGGDGNDYIDTGASGDLLYGEEGDDYMLGGADQDLMQGGFGDDILRPGAPSQAVNGGPDEVIGDDGITNSGFDLIDFSDYAGNAPGVVADMVTQFNPLTAIDGSTPFPAWWQIEGIIGSSNNDTFIGTGALNPAETANPFGGSNWLFGGSGDDRFTGGGGDDLIVGGSVRLDTLIGQYAGAVNGSLVLGSTAWLADAMQSGGAGVGYDNNAEDGYTGASNQALGTLSGGLLAGVNANLLGTVSDYALHFSEMLRSRMFRDVVLGDNGTDGTSDTVVFSGNLEDYSFMAFDIDGGLVTDAFANASSIYAIRVTDLRAGSADGSDLVVGVENFAFADQTINPLTYLDGALLHQNSVATGSVTLSDMTPTVGVALSATAMINDLDGLGTLNYQWQSSADNGLTWSNAGAASTNANYTPDAGVAGQVLRVEVSFIDGLGNAETVLSTATTSIVGTNQLGNGNANTLNGNAGDDILNGAGGNDILNGGLGDDALIGGANSLIGGDTAVFADGLGGVTFAVNGSGQAQVLSAEGLDTLTGVENLSLGGTNYNLSVRGATSNNVSLSSLGNDVALTAGGDDNITYNVGLGFSGRDFVDGGANGTAAGDRLILNGTLGAENFRVYSRAAFLSVAGNELAQLNANTEIVITRNGTAVGNVIAELDNVEEITINSTGVTVPAVPAGAGGDSISVIGDFTGTSLNFNTITLNVGANDQVDISELSSEHRIVLNGVNNQNQLVGSRPQDVINVNSQPTNNINGDDSANTLRGGAEADAINGFGGADRIFSRGGDDVVSAGSGRDYVWTADGDDIVHGDGDNDLLFLGDGDDHAWGGTGADAVYGGNGNDVFQADVNDGADRYFGGNGEADTLDMSEIMTNIEANLGSGTAMRGYARTEGTKDILYGIENIITGAGDDTIIASTEFNTIEGGDGADTFVFNSAEHANGDAISSFEPGDRLDFSSFMGQTITIANGAPSAGQVSVNYDADEDTTIIYGIDNTEDHQEFEVMIKGHHNLTSNNFA